ncbi:MAG TPA: sulfatase-like hydrolase/transferase [bacterium]|nr:sulfatase-like hydrolase/transferase [bacterium]HOL48810.1 sulfatase-like hydrolase/transferase [bacterium]HPQ19713.1 sulfatase-like hydrolase/transferase [bacterium]
MKKPNIIIIVLDGLRADKLFAYGSSKNILPFMNNLSEKGTVFLNHYSVANTSVPTHISMFTGTIPSYHKCASHYSYYNGEVGYLPEKLKENNYKTIGVINKSPYFSWETGFIRGFEKFYIIQKTARYIYQRNRIKNLQLVHATLSQNKKNISQIIKDKLKYIKFLRYLRYKNHFNFSLYNDQCGWTVVKTVEKISEELSKSDAPFFLFVNIGDTHMPFSPLRFYINDELYNKINYNILHAIFCPLDLRLNKTNLTAEEKNILIELVNAKTRYADDLLKYIYTTLEKKDLLKNSYIFITSDHGTSQLEKKSMFGHENSIYNSEIRIPLIMIGDGITKRSINKYTSIIDITPTINELCNIKNNEHIIKNEAINLLDNHQLHQIIFAEQPQPPEKIKIKFQKYPEYYRDLNTTFRAFITDKYKLLWASSGNHELYNLETDINETQNIFNSNINIAKNILDIAIQKYKSILGSNFFSLEKFDYTYSDIITNDILKNPQNKDDIITVKDVVKNKSEWNEFFAKLQNL